MKRVGYGLSNLYATILYRSVEVNNNLETEREAMYSGDLSHLVVASSSGAKVDDRSTLSLPSEGAYRGRLGGKKEVGRPILSRKLRWDAVDVVVERVATPMVISIDYEHTGDPPEISAELCSSSC